VEEAPDGATSCGEQKEFQRIPPAYESSAWYSYSSGFVVGPVLSVGAS